MKKRLLSLLLSASLLAAAAAPALAADRTQPTIAPNLISPNPAASSFTDISGHWGRDYIEQAAKEGFVTGFPDGSYKPDQKLKLSEFCTMMSQGFAKAEDAESSPWWKRFVMALYNRRLLRNTDLELLCRGGDEYVLGRAVERKTDRYTVAEVLYNLASDEGLVFITDADREAAKAKIADLKYIPSRHLDAVVGCYALGLLSGKGEQGFQGTDDLTRAEAAVVVIKMDELYMVAEGGYEGGYVPDGQGGMVPGYEEFD